MESRKAKKIIVWGSLTLIIGSVVVIAVGEAVVNKRLVKAYEETELLRKKTEEIKSRTENAKILLEKFSASLSDRQAAASTLMVTQRYFLDSPSDKSFLKLESDYNNLIRANDKLIEYVDEFSKIAITQSDISNETDRLELLKDLSSMATIAVEIKATKEKLAEQRKRINSKVVKIVADEIWQGSGLNAVKDDVVICTAKGQWRWGVSLGGWVDGRGEAGSGGYRLVSALGNGALLCAIKGSDKLNAALSHFSADRSGEVVLQINDTLVGDNRGHLDVTVFTFPWFDGKY